MTGTSGILRFSRIAGTALCCAALMAFSPAKAESLTDALRSAYKHSGLLVQNRALLRAADEDVAIAVAALYPIISYAASANYNNVNGTSGVTSTLSISAELTVYDGGRNKRAVDAQKENVLATREALISVEQQVLLRAVSAYMSVIRAAEFVSLRENNVRLITQELRAARDRFEVGEVTRTDVSIAEARLASARSGLAAEQGAYARAREEYLAAVGHYPRGLSNPPAAPLAAKTLDGAKAVALKRHPDVRQAQRLVTVADINVDRAALAIQPTIKLGANVGVNAAGLPNHGASLSLTGPIYQGGRLSALYRQAIARKDAARAALHVTSHNIRQGVANAWASLLVSRASQEASRRQVLAQRTAFRGVREEATLGSRTTLDVLNAEQELLDAQANQISAVTDQYIASYQLLASMGLLTVDHLRLGIQTYDPTAYYNAVRDAPVLSEQGKKLDRMLKGLGKK